MADILRPDLCVIGAGSGGLSVAAAAALFGVPVVLVEKDRMGGECLHSGCVPSKALIAAGAEAHAMRGAGAFGILAQEPKVVFAKVQAHVRGVIEAIAPVDSAERFTALGVRVIKAEARFTGPRTLVAGETTIMARRFVIATGSRPALPPIPGLESGACLTNETIFDLPARPRRLIVIGAGPVGLELAQAHRRLGSDVVVVESGIALAREDREIANEVLASLGREGVIVREGVSVSRVETIADGVRVILARPGGEGEEVLGQREVLGEEASGKEVSGKEVSGKEVSGQEVLEGSHVLVATGRQAVVDGLGLELAGIGTDARGIVVDASLRTANRHVFAIGDCAGGPFTGYRFTHVANYHAGLVIRSALFRLPVRLNNNLIPRVTFTDPEIASVGLTEEEARHSHKNIRVLRWPFAENDRAQAGHVTNGHIKVVTNVKGRILGCSIAGAHAGELIVPWIMALARKGSVQEFAGLVFPYPTLSEVSRRAALSFLSPSAANPWVRRLIGFLRKFG